MLLLPLLLLLIAAAAAARRLLLDGRLDREHAPQRGRQLGVARLVDGVGQGSLDDAAAELEEGF